MVKTGTGFFMPRSADDVEMPRSQPPDAQPASAAQDRPAACATRPTKACRPGSFPGRGGRGGGMSLPGRRTRVAARRSLSATPVPGSSASVAACGRDAFHSSCSPSPNSSSWHAASAGQSTLACPGQLFSAPPSLGGPSTHTAQAASSTTTHNLPGPEGPWDLGWDELELLPVVNGSTGAAAGFPVQQQPQPQLLLPGWTSTAEAHTLLVPLNMAAGSRAAAMPAGAAGAPVDVYSSAGCNVSSSNSSLLGLCRAGPPVLGSGSSFTGLHQHHLPGSLALVAPVLNAACTSTPAPPWPVLDLDSVGGGAGVPALPAATAMGPGSCTSNPAGVGGPGTGPCVLGNGVAAAAAAMAQDKLAQLQQLEMLQQQLRNDVVKLLPLI